MVLAANLFRAMNPGASRTSCEAEPTSPGSAAVPARLAARAVRSCGLRQPRTWFRVSRRVENWCGRRDAPVAHRKSLWLRWQPTSSAWSWTSGRKTRTPRRPRADGRRSTWSKSTPCTWPRQKYPPPPLTCARKNLASKRSWLLRCQRFDRPPPLPGRHGSVGQRLEVKAKDGGRREEEGLTSLLFFFFFTPPSLFAVPVLFPFCSRSVPAPSRPRRERLNLALVPLAA